MIANVIRNSSILTALINVTLPKMITSLGDFDSYLFIGYNVKSDCMFFVFLSKINFDKDYKLSLLYSYWGRDFSDAVMEKIGRKFG